MAGDRYCGDCGASISAGSASEARNRRFDERRVERRQVTVLFADLVGFTARAEATDPERVRELLDSYFGTCRTVIQRYGGTVEKFIGDAVMALWGAPIAREDDAGRAVRAALELIKSVSGLTDPNGKPLELRAGVTTGEAAVTLGAEGEAMVAGDVVNTAARLQTAAKARTVVVDETTKSATPVIRYVDIGTHALKGKKQRVQLWEADRVVTGADGATLAGSIDAPFVGRDREFTLLKQLFDASVKDRCAQLVSVTGVAGVGKTRLGWEFGAYLDGVARDALWHRGRSLAYEDGVAFWALAEMVRGRAQIAEGEDRSTALTKLTTCVETYVQDRGEARNVVRHLGQLLAVDAKNDAEQGDATTVSDRQELFAAWRVFLESMSATSPVVLVFEEAQWADEGVLDFIEYLMEWSRDHPIFVLTLARPELLTKRTGWGAKRHNVTAIHLGALQPADMEQLVVGLAPGMPASTAAQIVRRSDGVPLYAVETVRMLVTSGRLQYAGGRYRMQPGRRAETLPATLQALAAARLDALSAEERDLVSNAAVMGGAFSAKRVGAVSGIPESNARTIVNVLVEKEIFAVEHNTAAQDEDQYEFVQTVLRTVAYDMLSRSERRARHLAVAGQLESESSAGEELAEVIAAHYTKVLELDRDNADVRSDAALITRERVGQSGEKANGGGAREALTRAAQRAAAVGSPRLAVKYAEQGITLSTEPAALAQLHELAGINAAFWSQHERSEEHLEAATDLLRARNDARGCARVSEYLAFSLARHGQWQDAIRVCESALAGLDAVEAPRERAMLETRLALCLGPSGKIEESVQHIECALQIAESSGNAEPLCRAMMVKSNALSAAGRPHESMALARHALGFASDTGLPRVVEWARGNLLNQSMLACRFDEVLADAPAALSAANRIGDRGRSMQAISIMFYVRFVRGQWDVLATGYGHDPETTDYLFSLPRLIAAQALMLQGERASAVHLIEEARRLGADGDDFSRRAVMAAQSRLALISGDFFEAKELGERGFATISELGLSENVQECFVVACESAAALGDWESVGRLCAVAGALPAGKTNAYLSAWQWHFAARLANHVGDRAQAETLWKSAEDSFRQMHVPLGTASVLFRAGLARRQAGDVAGASSLLDEARGILSELRAVPLIEQLDIAIVKS